MLDCLLSHKHPLLVECNLSRKPPARSTATFDGGASEGSRTKKLLDVAIFGNAVKVEAKRGDILENRENAGVTFAEGTGPAPA